MSVVRFSTSMFATAVLAVLVASSASRAQAEVFSQIPQPFATTDYLGSPTGQSQFDAMPETDPMFPDEMPISAFASIYDNFSFSFDGSIVEYSWVGGYRDAGTFADSFTVSIFEDNTPTVAGATQPGNLVTALIDSSTFTPLQANETVIPGFEPVVASNEGGFYSYTATAPGIPIQAGRDYWFSVVANLDADEDNGNDWGVAFSVSGESDGLAIQDFQNDITIPDTVRFQDTIDYAFSVTAVPEPSSAILLATLGMTASLRRRRR